MKGWTSKSIGQPNSESDLQEMAISWFKKTYPQFDHSIIAIPNDGKRSLREGARAKRVGLLAGCWDILILIPKKGYGGLFIETKFGKNTLTDTQVIFREANRESYQFQVYRDIEHFKDIIKDWLAI